MLRVVGVPGDVAGSACGAFAVYKGVRYPADPPSIEEIVLVMRHAGGGTHGMCMRALIVVLWRAGLRIGEALALTESDLDRSRGAILVRHGKGDKRREVGMDQWGWEQLRPWLAYRVQMPVGMLFCVIDAGAAGGRRRRQTRAISSVEPQHGRKFGGVLRPISCATRTPSRWPAKAYR